MYDFSSVNDACVKCGKCRPVCTIFDIKYDETYSPRGFVELLASYQNGDLELDREVQDMISSCFLCTNCVEACPNDLPIDSIIEQARFELGKVYGIAWYKRLFFWLLRHRKMMDLMAKLGYVFQTCGIKINQAKQYATPRFVPLLKYDRAIPFAKKRSFLNSYPERISVPKTHQTPQKKTVGIYVGCMANYAYTDTGHSLVEILEILGYEIFIPKGQLCCAAPAYFTGAFDTVEHLIKKNIAYFETFMDDLEVMLIPEATCSAMIKEDWERFFYGDPDWAKRAKAVQQKIVIATKWLNDHTDLQDRLKHKKAKSQTITYHDPCHSRKVQGIYKEPRNLVGANYTIAEMSDPNMCCGFGGITMQTDKYHLSLISGAKKAEVITATKADAVSAECSACRMQISNALYQKRSQMPFKHPLELVRDALCENDC